MVIASGTTIHRKRRITDGAASARPAIVVL
jgi:hypothetical protein